MKIIDKIKNIEFYIRHSGGNLMKKNSNLVIAFVSVILLLVWMHLFIKYSESSVVNIFFLAINTFLIVYLVETGKNKENVNMERIILISSILFCSLCCFMEYINKLTLPFIILCLLTVYLLYFLKILFDLLNVDFLFILLMFIITMIIGLKTKNILIYLFKTITSDSIHKLKKNKKRKEDNDNEKNMIKLLIDNDFIIQLIIDLSIKIVDNIFDKLLEIEIIISFAKFLFHGDSILEIIFARGIIGLIMVAILSIITIMVKKWMDSWLFSTLMLY